MPTLSDYLAPGGPLIAIALAPSATQARRLRMALRPVPPPLSALALLDTGAEMSGVDASWIAPLGLPTRMLGLANVPAHGGLTPGYVYDASLTIVHPSSNRQDDLVIPDLSILELPLSLLGIQAVIGRDVLALCDFLYYGRQGRFELRY